MRRQNAMGKLRLDDKQSCLAEYQSVPRFHAQEWKKQGANMEYLIGNLLFGLAIAASLVATALTAYP